MDENILKDLGPLYHKYTFFGIDNEQLSGIFGPNQKAKEPIITEYIVHSIAKCKLLNLKSISFTELFCADGFYAMKARKLGCDKSIGIDNLKNNHFKNAKIISERLNIDNIEFIKAEINSESKFEFTDIVANIGGLYHVNDPEGILKMSYQMASKFLIVQSVVSLESNDEDYFISPAPGWTWGCRYSKQSFDKMIKRNCPLIIDQYFNLLNCNGISSKGSMYYLIQKP